MSINQSFDKKRVSEICISSIKDSLQEFKMQQVSINIVYSNSQKISAKGNLFEIDMLLDMEIEQYILLLKLEFKDGTTGIVKVPYDFNGFEIIA